MFDASTDNYQAGDTAPRQSFAAQQAALQQANFARQTSENNAGERANQRAARSNAGGDQGSATTKAVYRKGR